MRQDSVWQPILAATTVPLVTAIALGIPAFAANQTPNQKGQPSSGSGSIPQEDIHVAQVTDTCRQVAVEGGLIVREDPTVYSEALGTVAYGRNVTVETPQSDGWVAVSAPIPGYMYSAYLSPCDPQALAPENCREVTATGGLFVREEPSPNAGVVGAVANGRNVTISAPAANGWVPIQVPLAGYVAADYLTLCS
ncbi:SH3 domain-containing protein [Oculatella sp. LEGE 06141]|uniref:SH3 domain-containing protein n=1 Tax=Oculatella sp. LEGE 06141 TaxID=1828648 RepID=UPI00187EFB21|nr:SH3 domain-containing protein [Oculatella sp. LEGE 06141]MBE9182482.1 SH3 domain-containing protein [Oculatella sp. LEGE 06141]